MELEHLAQDGTVFFIMEHMEVSNITMEHCIILILQKFMNVNKAISVKGQSS